MLPLLELIVPAHVVVRGPVELLQVLVQRPCDLMIPGIGGTETLQWPMTAPMHRSRLVASRPQRRSAESRLLELRLQVRTARQVHLVASLTRLYAVDLAAALILGVNSVAVFQLPPIVQLRLNDTPSCGGSQFVATIRLHNFSRRVASCLQY